MRKFWIGTAVYVMVLFAGACAGFNALLGNPVKDSSQKLVAEMESVQRTSGKWTPVEIKREPIAAGLPRYVAPRFVTENATATTKQREVMIPERHRRLAERRSMRRVVITRRYRAETRQVFAYARAEQPQFFGPFRLGF